MNLYRIIRILNKNLIMQPRPKYNYKYITLLSNTLLRTYVTCFFGFRCKWHKTTPLWIVKSVWLSVRISQ